MGRASRLCGRFACGSRYTNYLINIYKGKNNKYNFSLLFSTIFLDIALSNYLLGSKDLEEDYALPIKNLRKRY